MAEFYVQNSYNRYRLRLTVSEISVDTVNNTSTLSYSLDLIALTSYSFSGFNTGRSVDINGVNVYYLARSTEPASVFGISGNTTKNLCSGTTVVAHEANGTKTVSVAYSIDQDYQDYSAGPLSGSGLMDLTAINRTKTITLNNQNATIAGTASLTATYGSAMPAITIPQRKYVATYNYNGNGTANTTADNTYIFGGYYTGTNGTGTQYYTSTGASARTADFTADTTLYAKWTAGNVILPSPTRIGYSLAGWYTAASGGSLVGGAGATYAPTANITLYAQWTPNIYDITFNSNGGDTLDATSKTVTYASTYGALPTPTRIGYSFNGWYTATSGGTKILDSTTVTITSVQTLYAQWTPTAIWKIKINGVWKQSPENYVKVSGAWKRITRIYIKVNGVWTPLI